MAKFDDEGVMDLSSATEAVTITLEGSRPKRISKGVVDIGPTLRWRKVNEEVNWRISPEVATAIRSDIDGKLKLLTLDPTGPDHI